jgi:hypothetical protein
MPMQPNLILPIAQLCKNNYLHEQQEIQTQAINLAQTTLVSSPLFIYDTFRNQSIIKKESDMATFFDANSDGGYQFTFINHSNRPIRYDLGPATGGQHNGINGDVNPGQQVDAKGFDTKGTLEQGNVPVISIADAPSPRFRFWSGMDGLHTNQYINVLAEEGYTVTKDTSEISGVTGNGFRVTVDGGGVNNPKVSDIHIQVYNA